MAKTVLILGDTHGPWHHQPTLDVFYDAVDTIKPQAVVQIGDLYDRFSDSKFPRSHDVITPQQELNDARAFGEALWKNIKERAPKASCYQILGNHDIRPKARILEKYPEIGGLLLKGWEDLYKFKGVDTLFDIRDDLVIDSVVYEHGFYGSPGKHCRENMRSTVLGHTHRGWVHFEQIRGDLIWELNVGYAADPQAEPLSYPRKKWVRWTHGYGLVDSKGPRFIPLHPKSKRPR